MSEYRVLDDGCQLIMAKVALDSSGQPVVVVEFIESISGSTLADLRSIIRALTGSLEKPVISTENLITQ
jgi:hypothetical protein